MIAEQENRMLFPVKIMFLASFLIAGLEMLSALLWYFKENEGILSILTHTIGHAPYYFWLIIVLVGVFPFTLTLMKQHNLRLSRYLVNKERLWGDIGFGLLAGTITFLIHFTFIHIAVGVPIPNHPFSPLTVLQIVSLVFVSGLFKEIYFRGLPWIFLKDRFGEFRSFLIGNTLFAILDWPNLGLSFILGSVWYFFYRKRKTIIVPAIAHGFNNLLAISVSLGLFQ